MTSTEPRGRALLPLIAAFVLLLAGAALYPALLASRAGAAGRLDALRSGRTEARRAAAEELGTGNEPDAAPILSGLIGALGDEDAGVRARAAHSLGRIVVLHPKAEGRDAARAALLRALGDWDGSVRGSSAIALALLGDDSDALVMHLADALRGRDPILRGEAVASLTTLGVKSEERLRLLLSLLRDGNPAVRDAAAHVLAKLEPGPDPTRRTAILVDALAEEEPRVRGVAAAALGRAGRGQSEACAGLVRMLSDPDASVRAAAAGALAAFADDEPARRALEQSTNDDAAVVREAAAFSLCDARRPAPDEALRSLAGALRQLGGHAELADSIAAGAGTDPAARLIPSLGDEDPRVRAAVARTLGTLGPKGESGAAAVAALAPLLRDRDAAVGVAAAWSLARLGKAARPAIPALRDAADHPDRRVSAFARAVIRRIDPPVSRGD